MIGEASRAVAILASAGAATSQWVQLLPLGSFKGRDGRGPWTIETKEDLDAVLAATLDRMGDMDLVVDYDHQSDFGAKLGIGGTAPAAGWITELQARSDGIWGLVEWTEAAAQKLKAREYRYLSPVFSHDRETLQVKCLLRAGLTNSPNLSLTAVVNSQMDDETHLAEIRSLLKLADDADMAEIAAALKAALSVAINAADPARFVPVEALEKVTAELNAARAKGSSAETAEVVVASAVEGGKLPPALASWAIELCQSDRAAFDGFLTRTAPLISSLTRRREFGERPRSDSSPGIVADVAERLGLTPDQMEL